jgi:hypothetical protein
MMRSCLIALLVIGGFGSVALCASYGWDQGGAVLKDQASQAFIYGFVSVATLVLHGVALRMYVEGWRRSGAFVGVVAMLAFAMTIFTSLGGLASREDKVTAQRQGEIKAEADVEGQIAKLESEKAKMQFTRVTQGAVDAAKRAVDTAQRAVDQECGKVGDNCRKRQDGLQAATGAHVLAETNLASTKRFGEIEADLKKLRSQQKPENGAGSANPLEALLTKIIGAWAALLIAWQKALFAVIYDLCLVALMISVEVLGNIRVVRTPVPEEKPEAPAVPVQPVAPVAPKPAQAKKPARPKIVASNSEFTVTMLPLLQKKPGKNVSVKEAFKAYDSACRKRGKGPLGVEDFSPELQAMCRKAKIDTKMIKGIPHLLDVEIVADMPQAQDIASDHVMPVDRTL